jgi:NAD(P)-dependent dehydrogenase (short-subunit alcohol dehydrogenase family)
MGVNEPLVRKGRRNMKQAVLEGPRRFVIQDIPRPEAAPGTVLVRVKYTSVCGSDIHIWQWGPAPEDPKALRAFEAVSQAFFGVPPEDVYKTIVQVMIPFKKPQTAEDIGNAVVFLASDEAQEITGQALNVCGGMKMN